MRKHLHENIHELVKCHKLCNDEESSSYETAVRYFTEVNKLVSIIDELNETNIIVITEPAPKGCEISGEHVISHMENAIDEATGPEDSFDKEQYLHELYMSFAIIGEMIEREEESAT